MTTLFKELVTEPCPVTVDAAQHFSGDLAVVLFEQKRAKLPGRFTTLSDQLDEFLLGLHDRTNRLRHVLTQNDVLRFAFAQVMYPYPFPGPEIKNADFLRLAAFDDLDLSAQVTEGNGGTLRVRPTSPLWTRATAARLNSSEKRLCISDPLFVSDFENYHLFGR